jgi:hypothetical protein
MVVMLLGYGLMTVSRALHLNSNQPTIDWGAAIWVIPYLIGMGVISYFGGFGEGGIFNSVGAFSKVLVGGKGQIHLYWDLLVVAGFSLAIYYLAISRRLSPDKVDHYVREVYPPPVAE